jgi:hypothetical protein
MQAPPTDPTDQLRWLVDRAAITDLLTALPSCANMKLYDTIPDLFTEDGIIEVPYATIPAADIPERVAKILGPFDATQHTVGNVAIEIDGDTATSRHYLYAVHVPDSVRSDQHADYGAVYNVDYRRTAAGWRIARVQLAFTYTSGLPFEPGH